MSRLPGYLEKNSNGGLFVAEESGYGKVRLIRKGAYEGMDVCLMYVSSSSSFGFVLTTQLGVIPPQDPRYPLACRAVSLLTRYRWTTMATRTSLRGHAYTEILIEE